MPCPTCIELKRQLKEAWETILRLDTELRAISELVRQIEQPNAPKAKHV